MSNNFLSKEQIEDLLDNVLHTPKRRGWRDNNIQFCCTIHGESNPSCGINIDFVSDEGEHYQVFNCFSCGAGGTIPWLVFKSLPDRFKSIIEAKEFLEERYGISYDKNTVDFNNLNIRNYEDSVEVKHRKEIPKYKIAPFKSGKETFEYFFSRGFDSEDVKKFSIGRDLKEETVTMPVFWEDDTLAGVIGRYISPDRPKNSRFKIYDNFHKGDIIFPLNKLEVTDNTIIGVESIFDCIRMHRWGYTNTIAIMGASMTKAQAQLIADRCNTFIGLFDNDVGGSKAQEIAKRRLKDKVMYLSPTYYPEEGKDPIEWGKEETEKVINSAFILGFDIPRYE